jgi:hypothetical protein
LGKLQPAKSRSKIDVSVRGTFFARKFFAGLLLTGRFFARKMFPPEAVYFSPE